MPQIPFAFQWSIDENRLLALKDSVNGCLYSTSVTNIPEFEYYLEICPNGDDDESRGQTWIFSHLKLKNVKKVEADIFFTIESANDSYVLKELYYGELSGWGYRVCKTDAFFDPNNKFFVNGKFNVKVNGIFKFDSKDCDAQDVEKQKWDGGELGDEAWEKNDTKDFVIISEDGKEIEVHKFILSLRSDVFAAMLNSNMKESIENKVQINDFPFKVVETGIKLIYHCTFVSSLSLDELMLLLQFFDKYNLPLLKAKVEPLLIHQISVVTVSRLTNASVLTNAFKLKEKCKKFLSAAFASKTSLHDFDILNKDIVFEIVKNSFYQIVEIDE